jgi:hypothetical protein
MSEPDYQDVDNKLILFTVIAVLVWVGFEGHWWAFLLAAVFIAVAVLFALAPLALSFAFFLSKMADASEAALRRLMQRGKLWRSKSR